MKSNYKVIKSSIIFRDWGADQITFYGGCLIRSRDCKPFTITWVQPRVFMGYVLPIFLGFYCVVLLCAITFLVPCCGIHFGFRLKTMFGSSLPPVVMPYLRYLCLFAHSGVQHILCSVFVLFVFFLCFVYPMLPVSLDCRFLIAPSVFSNVY